MEGSTTLYKVEFKSASGLWHSASITDLASHKDGSLQAVLSTTPPRSISLKELRLATYKTDGH
jgi:hypothetical protein